MLIPDAIMCPKIELVSRQISAYAAIMLTVFRHMNSDTLRLFCINEACE